MSEIREFHGGHVLATDAVWTVTFGSEAQGYEEIDLVAPRRASKSDVRSAAEVIIRADYMPGMAEQIVSVLPFEGVTIW